MSYCDTVSSYLYISYILLIVIILSIIALYCVSVFFFFQAEDGIRDLVRSRGLGDVYKRQVVFHPEFLKEHR